jgi:hypothetical protein
LERHRISRKAAAPSKPSSRASNCSDSKERLMGPGGDVRSLFHFPAGDRKDPFPISTI